MKKKKLRKWVQTLLAIIGIMAFLVLTSDCENTVTFIVTHIIGAVVLLGVAKILFEYGR